MSRQSTWSNSDGLVVGYGTHSKDNDVPAVVGIDGTFKTMIIEINGLNVPSAWAAANVYPQSVTIPRGSLIRRAILQVVTAFTSGGAATLSIGTYGGATYATTDVAAGLLSAAALATLNTVGVASSLGGTLVGSTLSAGATADTDVVIGYNYGTAAYTAGKAILTVEYVEPQLGNVVLA